MGPIFGGPAQRMINNHLGFVTPLSDANNTPLPAIPQRQHRFGTQPRSHSFTPHAVAASSVPPTPVSPSFTSQYHLPLDTPLPARVREPPISKPVSPDIKVTSSEATVPRVKPRVSPINQGPSQSQLLNEIFSGLTTAAPAPAVPTAPPHRPALTTAPPIIIPETPAPRIPWSERKSEPLLTPASETLSSSLTHQATPITDNHSISANNLDASPQLTPDMRDRADIDAVLGRIRSARAQFSNEETEGGDDHDIGRVGGTTRPGIAAAGMRSSRGYEEVSDRISFPMLYVA